MTLPIVRDSKMEKFRLSDQTGDCTNMLLGQKLNGKIFSSYFTKTHTNIIYSYKILKRRVVLHKASNIRKEHLIQFPRQSIFVLVFTFDLYLYKFVLCYGGARTSKRGRRLSPSGEYWEQIPQTKEAPPLSLPSYSLH